MTSTDKMMKRIELGILAGTQAKEYGVISSGAVVEFIYGTASGGLTPVESAIADLELGRSKEVQVAGDDLRSFFGCHFRQLEQHFNAKILPPSLYLRLTLRHCEEVDPREVVKAISGSLVGGCASGGCGCGCG